MGEEKSVTQFKVGDGYRTIYEEVLHIQGGADAFFFSSTVLLEMFNIISCQKTSNGMTSGRRRPQRGHMGRTKNVQRLQQMGSHLPLMTSHNNSVPQNDIPQLPT